MMTVLLLLISFSAWCSDSETERYVDEREQVVVSFPAPDKLSDLELDREADQEARERFAATVHDYFLGPGDSLLADRRLELDVLDVDMAGEIQPWRSDGRENIRFIENLYPARLTFAYRLYDAQGQLLDSGEVEDQLFVDTLTRSNQRYQPFHHEIELLARWWRGYQ